MIHNILLEQLFLPDMGPYSLSNAWAARSGSGKTTLLTELVNQCCKTPSFKGTRFIYVSVKGEHMWDPKMVQPTTTVDDLFKNISENQISVFYPIDPENYESDIDQIIEGLFITSDNNPEANFHIIIDDANILDGFDNRGTPSTQMKKLAVAGRSKGIRGTFILHRIGNLPRLMNGNLANLVLLNVSNLDADYSKKIFGLDFEPLVEELRDFKWVVVDLVRDNIMKFNPINVS